VFHVFAALAEFERELIRERTNAGLAAARARGRHGGRPPRLTADQVKTARRLYDQEELTVGQIGDVLGVSRTTIYRALERQAAQASTAGEPNGQVAGRRRRRPLDRRRVSQFAEPWEPAALPGRRLSSRPRRPDPCSRNEALAPQSGPNIWDPSFIVCLLPRRRPRPLSHIQGCEPLSDFDKASRPGAGLGGRGGHTCRGSGCPESGQNAPGQPWVRCADDRQRRCRSNIARIRCRASAVAFGS
jgi:hypothetical protein